MNDRYIPPDSCSPSPDKYNLPVEAYEKDGKKFVKVHGREIEVRPDEECSNCELRLCALVEHMPGYSSPHSAKSECNYCHKPVFYDTRLPIGEKQKLICMYCAMKEGTEESFAV